MRTAPLRLSDQIIETNRRLRGAAANGWLKRLPATIERLCREWDVELEPPFSFGYGANYVAAGRRGDSTQVVLKATFPNHEFATELASLRLRDGNGAVPVLAADEDEAVMLMRRASPGTMLAETLIENGDDEAATAVAAVAMRAFWRPVPAQHPFPSTEDWGEGFARHRGRYGGHGQIPQRLFERAEELFRELGRSAAPAVVLHGDFHHENILRDGRDGEGAGEGWTVIDPKGVTGEPAYELGSFLRNPLSLWEGGDHVALLRRRVEIFAELLALDPQRIAAWAAAQAVLSVIWSAEDGLGLAADGPWRRCIETSFALHDGG